jgi:hypothetical protein
MVPIKSKGIAYILWFFFGIFGAHRSYNALYKMPTKFVETASVSMLKKINVTNKTFFVN